MESIDRRVSKMDHTDFIWAFRGDNSSHWINPGSSKCLSESNKESNKKKCQKAADLKVGRRAALGSTSGCGRWWRRLPPIWIRWGIGTGWEDPTTGRTFLRWQVSLAWNNQTLISLAPLLHHHLLLLLLHRHPRPLHLHIQSIDYRYPLFVQEWSSFKVFNCMFLIVIKV